MKKNIRKANRTRGFCPIKKIYCQLVEHHINGRTVENPSSPSNILWVSPEAHDLIHSGQIIIEKYCFTTDGLEIIWHNKGDESITGSDSTPPLYQKH